MASIDFGNGPKTGDTLPEALKKLQDRLDDVKQTYTKNDVGLGNVDNTADANKSVASASRLTTPRKINGVSFDGTSDVTVVDSALKTDLADPTKGSSLIGTVQPGTQRRPRTQAAKNGDMPFLDDWNGSYDSAHINKALSDLASSTTRKLYTRPNDGFVIDAPIVIPPGCDLIGNQRRGGNGLASGSDVGAPYKMLVTALQGQTDGNAITLRNNASIEGFTMVWPNQAQPSASAPVQHGWAIGTTGSTYDGDGIGIRNMMLVNPTKAIRVVSGGQWRLEHVYGQPLQVGILLDKNGDGGSIHNVEFFPYWCQPGTPLFNYVQANAKAFQIKRQDAGVATDTLGYGYRNFISFEDSDDTTNYPGGAWMEFVGFTADQCQQPILITKAQSIILSNGRLVGAGQQQTGDYAIEIGDNMGGELLINGVTPANVHGGLRSRTNTGTINVQGFRPQRLGTAGDVGQYDYVIEGTARHNIDAVDPTNFSGSGPNIRIGNFKIPAPEQSLASTFSANLKKPETWSSSSSVTAIANGASFDMSGGIAVQGLDLPVGMLDERGVFRLFAKLKFVDPNSTGMGGGQFYFRVSGGGVPSDQIMPASAINGTFKEGEQLVADFLIRGGFSLQLQIVYGGAGAGTRMEVTSLDIYRVEPTQCEQVYLEWLHKGTTNTGGQAPNIAFRNGHRLTFAPVVPANGTFRAGEERINSNPVSGNPTGWATNSGGSPGTWLKTGTFST